eukprot:scaffold7864_cov122-Skeletonema_dohrnii-CCMP3373.AAC.17
MMNVNGGEGGNTATATAMREWMVTDIVSNDLAATLHSDPANNFFRDCYPLPFTFSSSSSSHRNEASYFVLPPASSPPPHSPSPRPRPPAFVAKIVTLPSHNAVSFKDIEYERDESGRRLNLFKNLPEKLDKVELEDGLMYKINGGFVPPGWTYSGQDIFLPPSTIIDDATATITLPNSGRDRLLEGDAYVPRSRAQSPKIKSATALNSAVRWLSWVRELFLLSKLLCPTVHTDLVQATWNANECSYGKLQFNNNKATHGLCGYDNVSAILNGVVTVTLPTASTSYDDEEMITNAVTSALNTAFGSATSLADHLMYCLPPNTSFGGVWHDSDHGNGGE